MARTDALVLGAGIVGTSIALHLAKRGLAALLRVAFKRATEANYHLSFLPQVAPWLLAYRSQSALAHRMAFAEAMRPLFARALPEHEALIAEAEAGRYLRKSGWLKVYRSEATLAGMAPELELAGKLGLPHQVFDPEGAHALEPALAPVFRRAIFWSEAASITNPLALTRAYVARFVALSGLVLKGDARSLHRNGAQWRIETPEGPVDAPVAVLALGPWMPDVLGTFGLHLPLAVKRGYHRHFKPRGNAGLSRPVVD